MHTANFPSFAEDAAMDAEFDGGCEALPSEASIEIISILGDLFSAPPSDRASFRKACEIVGSIDDDAVYEDVLEAFPGVANYDSRGNWVGSVRNENGFTA